MEKMKLSLILVCITFGSIVTADHRVKRQNYQFPGPREDRSYDEEQVNRQDHFKSPAERSFIQHDDGAYHVPRRQFQAQPVQQYAPAHRPSHRPAQPAPPVQRHAPAPAPRYAPNPDFRSAAPAPPAPAPHYAPAPARHSPAPAPAPVQRYAPAPAPAPVQRYAPAPAPAPQQRYEPAPPPQQYSAPEKPAPRRHKPSGRKPSGRAPEQNLNGDGYAEEPEEEQGPDALTLLLQDSKFSCSSKKDGYYADNSVNCQVFHYCVAGARHSWMCPAGTVFHQVHLNCVPASQDICGQSEKFHFVNDYLHKPYEGPNNTVLYHQKYYPDGYSIGDPLVAPPPSKPRQEQQHYQSQEQSYGPAPAHHPQPKPPHRPAAPPSYNAPSPPARPPAPVYKPAPPPQRPSYNQPPAHSAQRSRPSRPVYEDVQSYSPSGRDGFDDSPPRYQPEGPPRPASVPRRTVTRHYAPSQQNYRPSAIQYDDEY